MHGYGNFTAQSTDLARGFFQYHYDHANLDRIPDTTEATPFGSTTTRTVTLLTAGEQVFSKTASQHYTGDRHLHRSINGDAWQYTPEECR